MHLSKHVRHILWFGIPFVLVLGLIAGTRILLYPPAPERAAPQIQEMAVQSPLLGQTLPTDQLVFPKTRLSVSELDWAMPDSAIVILLGGMGCSGDQVKLLSEWSKQSGSRWQDYPVLAVYADPIVGEEPGIYETLVLRRVSQAQFPFFVSPDTLFSPRNLGVRTPQVVLTESGVITRVIEPVPVPAPRQAGIAER